MIRTGILAAALAIGLPTVSISQDFEIFNNGNKGGIEGGTARSPMFRLQEPTFITRINHYHWLSGGKPPGTISLRHESGRTYGPWQATGGSGSGRPNVVWQVTANTNLPPGTYTIIDSDPGTWAFNSTSNGYGFSQIFAQPPSDFMQATSPQASGSFGGTWDTDFNKMSLNVSGGRVTGSYEYAGGKIEGTVSGNVARGTWTQSNAHGGFVWQLSPDGRSFTGTWGYDANSSGGGNWKGTRTGGAAAPSAPTYAPPPAAPSAPQYAPPPAPTYSSAAASYAGTWESTFSKMSLTQSGNRVTGTYEHADGRIEGVVSGNELRGSWQQSNAKGQFVFRLSADGNSFDGTWGYDAASTGGGWKGTRIGGAPAAQAPTYTAPPAPAPSAPARANPPSRGMPSGRSASIAGTWDTDFQRMTISVSGSRVTGSYAYAGGQIEGVVSGNTVRGTWTQTNGRGAFVWQVSSDGMSFTGTWGYNASESAGGKWNGTRVGAPPTDAGNDASVPSFAPSAPSYGANWAGTWSTDFNRLTLQQSGNRVWGTYEHSGGQVEGTINGMELRGTWSQTNGKGRIVWRLSADGQSFNGQWGYNDAEPSSQWNGRRTP